MAKSAKSHNKKVAQTHDLIYAAYHEAGHTIYGLLHFMRIECANIFFNKDTDSSGGFTHYNYPDINDFTNDDIRLYVINSEISINYAGLSSERYHFKQISGSNICPMFLKDGASEDTLESAKLFRQYNIVAPGKKRYLYKKKLIKNTMQEIETFWADITLIAHGLYKRKKLYFSDLKKILVTKSENKEYWREQLKLIEPLYKNSDKIDENYFMNILSSRGLL